MTITTIRPDSNKAIDFSGITLIGIAPTVWQALSDNSDTTYVGASTGGSGAGTGVFQCAVGTGPNPTLTGTQRVYSVTTRARIFSSTSNARAIDFSVKFGADMTVTPVGKWTGTMSSSTTKTLTGAATSTQPGGTEWDQNHLNFLVIDAELHAYPNSPNSAFLVELYADIDTRSQVTVTGQAASNFTNNSEPTISWGFNDPDNGVVTTYWVKIFDSATVNSTLFNPLTSDTAWDSGPVATTDTSITVGTPLNNGTTYYAYVRVAKYFPLKSSQQLAAWQEAAADYLWWSPWAPTTSFTPTYVPPLAPVINAWAVLSDSNQYRAQLQVTVPVNLLSADNASFETSIGDWKALTNCTVGRSTVRALDGIASMAVTGSGAGNASAFADLSGVSGSTERAIVDPGTTYAGLASFRANTTVRSVQVGLRWHLFDNTTAATVFGTAVADTNTGWTSVTVTGVAPANALYVDLVVQVQSTVLNEIHFVDKLSLAVGTGSTWMPGGYANDQGDVLLERGEYVDDARGPVGNMFALQVASAGSQLRTTDGFSYATARVALVEPLTWLWLNKLIPTAGDTPAGMLRWTPAATGVNTESIEIGNMSGGSATQNTVYNVPVVPGRQYTFDLWMWADTAVAVTPTINFRDVTGITVISSPITSPVTLSTTPQLITVTGTAPGGAFYASGHVGTPTVYTHIYLTRPGFADGAAVAGPQRGLGFTDGVWTTARYISANNPLHITRDSRFANTTLPPGPFTGQVENIADYEYPPGRTVIYRASVVYSVPGGANIKSDYSYAAVYGDPPPTTLLRSVTDPTLQVAVNRRKAATLAINEDAQVFHPLGADGAPVKVRDWVGGEDGQLVVVLSSAAQYRRLRDLLVTSNVVLIQWAQGGRTYALITGRSIADTLTSDIDFCDADGSHTYLQFDVITLDYLETVAP